MIVTGRRSEPLEKLIQKRGNLDFLFADAADPKDASRTVSTVIERWGRLDVLVNNAGAGAILPLEAATFMAITQIFAVNVFGPTLLATAALPYLKATGGNIVNVFSTFGQSAAAALSHYAASKAALEHMTRCWALEFAEHRIRVMQSQRVRRKRISSRRGWAFPMNRRTLSKPRSGVAFPWGEEDYRKR